MRYALQVLHHYWTEFAQSQHPMSELVNAAILAAEREDIDEILRCIGPLAMPPDFV